MIFFYMASFMQPYGIFIATAIFICAALTDLFDGKIARKRGEVTDLGKLLDPIADKLLYSCGLLLVVADGTIPAPYGVIALAIVLFRDILINAVRQVGVTKGVVIAASLSGKLKAIFHYIQIPMFMFLAATSTFVGDFWNTFNYVWFIAACVVLAVATVITIWSCFDYVLGNKQIFKSEKEEK